MDAQKKNHSLRWHMIGVVLICWLLPVLLVLGIMTWSVWDALGQRAEQGLAAQLQLNLRMCADRVDTAASASRLASYDPTIRNAWEKYRSGGRYADLYRDTKAFLNRQYGSDSRFLFSVFWFHEAPEQMTLSTITGYMGGMYLQVNKFWSQDFFAANDLAQGLDTALGFLERDGRCYMVRNLLNSRYETIGTLVLALNQPYYFENFSALPWLSSTTITLNDVTLSLNTTQESAPRPFYRTISDQVEGSGYTLAVTAELNYKALLSQFSSFKYLLLGMALLLLPLLILTFRFLRHKVQQPVDALMAGAAEIEGGKLGHQLSYQANSREFQYLTDAMNHMSGQLQHQFTRLYQEELALRDARMKALQSHINPHFLNNTLEIINWEARMGGAVKVSKMIEALSTVLDAALDRDKRPEIRLAEEMSHVGAYLYIVSERYGKRLTVQVSVPESLMDCMVPRLILQPVIENAVEHGFGPTGQGTVTIRAFQSGDFLVLETENDGGLSPEDEAQIACLLSQDYDPSRGSTGSIGIGIANVNLRLRLLYGADCGLSITRGAGSLVIARITIAYHLETSSCPDGPAN